MKKLTKKQASLMGKKSHEIRRGTVEYDGWLKRRAIMGKKMEKTKVRDAGGRWVKKK